MASKGDNSAWRVARGALARASRGFRRAGHRLAARKGGATGGAGSGVNPGNIVWIFGTARSGSTWLASMMGDLGHHVWNEPLVGAMLGNFYYERARHRANDGGRNFILGQVYKDTWLGPVRDLVLGGAAARFPALAEGGSVVIKEPNGSVGAPLLMEALPESRMIFLIRDPRDVVASSMDARKEGSWRYLRRQRIGDTRAEEAARKVSSDSDQFVRNRARGCLQAIGNARLAYDAHRGRKALVRYEDLRTNTVGELRRIYSELEIPVEEDELSQVVERHSWESIPEEKKGEGKFYRKASPGSWREDLTEEQIRIVERVTAPILEEFYSGG